MKPQLRANRLLELSRIARDEANHHDCKMRDDLIHVATGLSYSYRRCAGDGRNLDTDALGEAIAWAAALIAAAVAARTEWKVPA